MALKIVARIIGISVGIACFCCSCITPYGELGPLGGVTSTRIDEHRLSVFAKGNGVTEMITLRNYILRRSAEDAIKAGYSNFEILHSDQAVRQGQYTTAAIASHSCGKHGCTSYYAPSETVTTENPVMQADVYMSNSASAMNPGDQVYNASEILRFMAPQGAAQEGAAPDRKSTAATASPASAARCGALRRIAEAAPSDFVDLIDNSRPSYIATNYNTKQVFADEFMTAGHSVDGNVSRIAPVAYTTSFDISPDGTRKTDLILEKLAEKKAKEISNDIDGCFDNVKKYDLHVPGSGDRRSAYLHADVINDGLTFFVEYETCPGGYEGNHPHASCPFGPLFIAYNSNNFPKQLEETFRKHP